MAGRRAWVLNLDADLELASRAGYTPRASVRRAMTPHAKRLAATLLGPEDIVVDESSPPGTARGLAGRAFCPTPRALDILARALAEPEPHPTVDVLRRVNSRAFAASLGQSLPSGVFVTELGGALLALARARSVGNAWRVKRAFGLAGRGQRVIDGGSPLGELDLAWLKAGLAESGLQIEPNLVIEVEYALHGMLAADGTLRLGRLVCQRCDARGAWVSTEPALHDDAPFAHLADEAGRVAHALFENGYFGPFGVDAYTYRDREGSLHLQPRSEINARYSMGFATGFGSR